MNGLGEIQQRLRSREALKRANWGQTEGAGAGWSRFMGEIREETLLFLESQPASPGSWEPPARPVTDGRAAVRSRGRVLALNGGCFLQRRVSRWAQSYPTGIDVDFSHTPQMADHCPTTWLGHTEFTGMSNPIIDHLVNVSYIALYLFRGLNVSVCLK